MADENPDQAALDAVSEFFSGDNDAAAAAEVAPEGVLYTEQQQQDDAQEEAGAIDRTQLDEEVQKQADEKPAAVVTPKTTTAAASETAAVDEDLRSAAKEFGWTDAKIDRLIKADPELAKETFEQLAANLADTSRSFLPKTPATQAAVQQQAGAAQNGSQQQAIPAVPPQLSDEALKKFAETNGQEAADMLKLIRDQYVAPLAELNARVAKAEQAAQAQELKAVAAEATTTIGDIAKKHPAIYGAGEDVNKLSVEQYNRRAELTGLADQIRVGAASQGRQLTVKQALTHAHYILSRDAVKQETVKEVAASVKKRAAAATQRPTARTNPTTAAGGSKTEAGAAEAYQRRMVELGIADD